MRRLVLAAVTIVGLAGAALGQLSETYTQCVNKAGAFTRDVQISGCTSIIQSGKETRKNLAIAYYYRGNAYIANGEHDRAIADNTRAIEIDPKYSAAYNNRGDSFDAKGERDRAIADYTRAIEINSKDALAYLSRAWVYFKVGKAAQGLPDAERSVELNPNDAYAFEVRGHIFEALERREEAIADFRRALAKNPNIQLSKDALKRLGAGP